MGTLVVGVDGEIEIVDYFLFQSWFFPGNSVIFP